MVKNAVIVPVGAKGGFVLKRPPPASDRAAFLEEGVRCYKVFLRGLLDITDNLTPGGVVPPRGRGPLRRRRPLPRGRRRQGHRHLLRLRQRRQPGVWLLARRRLRLGRLGRLRPQEDGHHGQGCLGIGQAALPRARARYPDRRSSRSSASATCRATCSATACCCRRRSGSWRPSTIATSSSTPIPTRHAPSPSGSACSTCRARAGTTTTRA